MKQYLAWIQATVLKSEKRIYMDSWGILGIPSLVKPSQGMSSLVVV